MRIAVDASRTTIARRTGTENYALQLIRALLPLANRHHITLYFRDQPAAGLFPDYAHVQQRVIPFRRAWTHLRFADALRADRPDIAFVPAHTLPFVFPGRAVVTVHDLGYRLFPAAHPLKERLYLELTTRYSARRASRILADSQATKRDLVAYYRTRPEKVDVVYPGVEGITRAGDVEITRVRTKYDLPARYLLFLGTLQPRKNITRLVRAYASYVERSADPDLGLVLAGNPGWLMDVQRDVFAALPAAIANRVRITGYIADEDVAALYSGALALTFPSLYEGFGFPVVEAMRCGVPVLCSNTSSLPELVGAHSEAAVLVNPLEVDAITEGMTRLVQDATLRERLIRAGAECAQQFTWQRAAEATLQTIEAAAL